MVESAGGEAVIISRTGKNNYQNLSRHTDARWIVNATPVGMHPNVDGCLLNLSDFPALSGVLDVVYNPLRTPLIQQAQALKIPAMGGLYMLCAQAAQARELLTGTLPDADAAYQALLRQRLGVALIGMPGAGKSTLARRLAQLLPLELHDTDDEIAQSAGQTIPELFKAQGEAAFRALEAQAVAQAGSQGGRIIAAGGGAALREDNRRHLRQNCLVVWVQRDLQSLPLAGRPISQSCPSLQALYDQRAPLYAACADITVSNNGSIEDCAREIAARYQAAVTAAPPAASAP